MTANILLAYITIISSAFFLVFSLQLPLGTLSNVGAGGWPTSVLILLFIMGIVLLVKTIYQQKQEKIELAEQSEIEEIVDDVDVNNSKKHLVIALILSVYIMGIKYAGFTFATPIFIVVLAYVLGMKHKIKLFATAAISTVCFVYLFAVLLGIPFPRGVGLFREFSLLFY